MGGGFLLLEVILWFIDKMKGIIGEMFIFGVEGGINVLDIFMIMDVLLVFLSNMIYVLIGNYMCIKLFWNMFFWCGIINIILYFKYLKK